MGSQIPLSQADTDPPPFRPFDFDRWTTVDHSGGSKGLAGIGIDSDRPEALMFAAGTGNMAGLQVGALTSGFSAG